MQCVAVRNDAALNAFGELSRLEGIIPSLESAHAVAHACTVAAGLSSEANLVVCLSGRGEKDLSELAG
jgi:tryptophan synthase beta subunit